MTGEKNGGYSFGEFELDTSRRLLLRQGQPVDLKPKTFDLLLVLVENHDKVLSKSDLLDMVWENQFVEENNLTVHVAALRRALGESKRENRFIMTVPGRGYRFVADMDETAIGDILIETRKLARIVVEETEIHEPDARNVGRGTRTVALALAGLVLVALALVGFQFWRPAPTPPPPFAQPSLNRLTSSGKVNSTAISPDGKYFAYSQLEPEGESLWLRQVTESRSIELVPADAVEYWGITFAPDGLQVYCTVFTAKQADPKLIRVPTIGGVVETLPNVPTSGVTFSPDGRRFAYVVSSSGAGGTLLRIANADGSDDKHIAILKYPSYFVFPGSTVAWSADGTTIAVASKTIDDTGEYGALMAVNVADGRMSTLTTRRFPAVMGVSALPGNAGWIITANEDASSPVQVWHQPPAPGEPRRVTNDLSWYSSIATTSDGNRLIANQETTNSGVWVADYADGVVGNAREIASEIGSYGEFGWTKDGNLVYRSTASGKQNLWMMTASGSGARQLTTDAMPDKGLAVSPDGRYIVFSSYRAGQYNLWRIDANGGNLTQLTNGKGETHPRITPDSSTVIFQQGTGEVIRTLWKLPIEGGAPVQLTKTSSIFPALSPDGKFISHFYMDTSTSKKGQWRIGIVSADDGSMVRSIAMPENIIGRVVRWAPDSSSIVYAKSNGNVGNLWLQSLDDTPPVQITDFDKLSIGDFAFSHDGRSIVISREHRTRDVVLVGDAGLK